MTAVQAKATTGRHKRVYRTVYKSAIRREGTLLNQQVNVKMGGD
jgi:hypothetical protein